MKQQGNNFELCGMKFIKAKFDGLDGKTVITFVEDSGIAKPFEVRITENGMQFRGEMVGKIFSEKEIQELAQFMSVWVQDLRKIRTKIETNFAGH